METVKQLTRISMPLLRVILGALFVYAGVAKLMDVAAFAAQIQRFGLEHAALARAGAYYLPFLEIACGLALIIHRFTLGASLLSIALLVVFECALAYAWHRGYEGGCGCFGKLFGGSSIQAAFIRNLGLLAAAGMLLVRELSLSREELQ